MLGYIGMLLDTVFKLSVAFAMAIRNLAQINYYEIIFMKLKDDIKGI